MSSIQTGWYNGSRAIKKVFRQSDAMYFTREIAFLELLSNNDITPRTLCKSIEPESVGKDISDLFFIQELKMTTLSHYFKENRNKFSNEDH